MTETAMTHDQAVAVLVGIRSADGSPSLERLAAIYTGDLDAIVPRALTWSQRTRRTANRLLRTVLPVLRELVAEIVVQDRAAQEAQHQIEVLQARPAPLTSDSSPHARLAAAHDVARRLTERLQPAPRSVTVENTPHASRPVVIAHTLDDGPAVEAWASMLGVPTARTVHGNGYTYVTATCTIDGVDVSLETIVLPRRAEVTV
ncbi:hypothetical protein GCM10009639_52180 [Kitasatospora putterlickiae]|uniref:HNH endonuclease n=1 Tax=Kitasatospora putterlickiae TaxID=221725 RepID=A0ABN1YES4_9ACTN